MNDETVIKVEADELIIEPINGKVIDLENSDLSVGKIVFKKKENELPTKWEDLKKINGYFVNNQGCIKKDMASPAINHKNTFPTKEEAEACLALSQLCQLRDAYNGEPLADWCDLSDSKTIKYCIEYYEGKLSYKNYTFTKRILTFKTKELRDKFAENFEYLILTAEPLL